MTIRHVRFQAYNRSGGHGVSNSFNFTQVAEGGNSYGGLVNVPILSGNAINIAL